MKSEEIAAVLMRTLPPDEREVRITSGIEAGKVIDGRRRFAISRMRISEADCA